VAQFAWQDVEDSHLLAMVISADDNVGNGIHLFDAVSSELRVLESSDADYQNLAWRKGSADLAVLKGKKQEDKDGFTQAVLLWTGLESGGELHTFDPTTHSDFPEGLRTVPFRPLTWSADGDLLFLGIAEWADVVSSGDEVSEEGEEAEDGPPSKEDEDLSTVEIWHWTDTFVMPWQKSHAAQDRQRNMLAALNVDTGRFVQLGQDLIEERVTPIPFSDFAFVSEWSKYAMERSIGRPGSDLYLQDMARG
jgi:hypothetical protein